MHMDHRLHLYTHEVICSLQTCTVHALPCKPEIVAKFKHMRTKVTGVGDLIIHATPYTCIR